MAEREFSFDRACREVAQDIADATIITDTFQTKVLHVREWPKEYNTGRKYEGIRAAQPGQLVGTFHMSSQGGDIILSLIRTGDESCLQLMSLEIRGEGDEKKVVKGPGLVSKTLGLRRGEIRTLEIVEHTIPPILRVVSQQ